MQSIMYMLLPITIANAIGYKKEEEAPPTPPPEETWYEVTIDNSANSNNLTEYQVLLEINNDEQFFNDFNNDQVKIEVYDEDKSTLIPFYIEEWDTTNKNAKIWIKVPSIPANTVKKVYLKYNPDRTESLSNPNNVFEWFDNFENYSLGDLVGQNEWIQYEDYSSARVVNSDKYEGSQSARCFHDGTTDNRAAKHNLPLTSNFKLLLRWKLKDRGYATSSEAQARLYINNTLVIQMGHRNNTKDTFFYKYAGNNYWTSKPLNLDEWYLFKILVDNSGLRWIVNDEQLVSISEDTMNRFVIYADEGCEMYIDLIMLCKYSSPEPSVSYSKL